MQPSQPDGLASDSDIRRPRRKSEVPGLEQSQSQGQGQGQGQAGSRHYRKHHEYCSSGGEGSGRPDRPASSSSTSRPVPPRKPLRLSLHRAASLQSVESAPPAAPAAPHSATNGTAGGAAADKKAPKRNHKGEAPGIPSDAPHPHPFQSALRWTAAAAASPSASSQHVYRSSGNLTSSSSNEKWC